MVRKKKGRPKKVGVKGKKQTKAKTKKQKIKRTRQTTIGNKKPRGPAKVK